MLGATLAAAAFLRLWEIDSLGFNSDEAVYSGQAAAIADEGDLGEFFPIFRAHPLLFQALISIGFLLDLAGPFERMVSAGVGVATVVVVYMLGSLLYGRKAGLIAALFMALMPYHVVVTRQVLLDAPMTLFATLTLYLVARFALSGRSGWLYAAAAALDSPSYRRRPASSWWLRSTPSSCCPRRFGCRQSRSRCRPESWRSSSRSSRSPC